MASIDDALFEDIFTAEGASTLLWEVASRCSCYSEDSKQPQWGHELCGGLGVVYADPVTIRALFRAQSRYISPRREGELDHGEAQLTTRLEHKPGYTDRRVRDRYTVVPATGDAAAGRVFYPAAVAVPFIFDNVQRAWRVQLQSMEQSARIVPQP